MYPKQQSHLFVNRYPVLLWWNVCTDPTGLNLMDTRLVFLDKLRPLPNGVLTVENLTPDSVYLATLWPSCDQYPSFSTFC